MFVKAVLKGGHVGAGKYHEMTRYLKVRDMKDLLTVANHLPRVKKSRISIIWATPIGFEEYQQGKLKEAKDPYLFNKRCKQ